MSSCVVQPFADQPQAREELAGFLACRVGPRQNPGAWLARLAHWWDQNPFASLTGERGWVLRSREDDELVGFLGLIPACYAVDGEPVPAVSPTTWAVDPRHRQSALMLGRRLGRLEGRVFIVSTTGRKDFQARLVRRGWQLHADATRQFVPCGRSARLWLGQTETLPPGARIVTSLDEVSTIARSFQNGRGIEKWITPAALRWYLNSPARRHRFAGMVDAEGCLSAFLVLAPAPVFGLVNAWSVVDWFCARQDVDDALRTLLAAVASAPAAFGLGRRCGLPPILVRLTAMAGDSSWAGVRGLLRARVSLNHLHLPPASWPPRPKRCVLAEGDLGL